MLGTMVQHLKYGRGKVLKSQQNGYRMYIEFENGTIKWVLGCEVEPDKQITNFISTKGHETINDNPTFDYRRMIEAFRLGVVPYDKVEEFTYGREQEVAELLRQLSSNNLGTSLIVGEYGSGKTHLANYMYWRALKEGYAVARVELDSTEIPLSNPKKIYGRLIDTFCYKTRADELKGFREFIRAALWRGAFHNHLFFKHLAQADESKNEDLWYWIEGRYPAFRPVSDKRYILLPGMPNYGNASNVYCYLLSSLSWAAKEYLGLKGLLLLFDEAEVIDVANRKHLLCGCNLINALVRLSNNDAVLLGAPDKTGLDYSRANYQVPFMYSNPGYLKVCFVFTPTEAIKKVVELQNTHRIDLHAIDEEGLQEIYTHVRNLYLNAYPPFQSDLPIDRGCSIVLNQTEKTRSFVKGTVELMDILRLGRECEKAEIAYD